MKLATRATKDLSPFQLSAFSGATAVEIFQDEEPSLELNSDEYRVFPENQLRSNPTESLDLESGIIDTDGLSVSFGQKDQVVRLKRTTPIRSKFIELQKWEGIVVKVYADSFAGRLTNVTTADYDSEAEFSFDELHDEDRPFVTPGAVFYWTIGYAENRGQRIRASIIRFRRLPVWQKDEIETAKQEAQKTGNLLQW